jgi:hypothetical protein
VQVEYLLIVPLGFVRVRRREQRENGVVKAGARLGRVDLDRLHLRYDAGRANWEGGGRRHRLCVIHTNGGQVVRRAQRRNGVSLPSPMRHIVRSLKGTIELEGASVKSMICSPPTRYPVAADAEAKGGIPGGGEKRSP